MSTKKIVIFGAGSVGCYLGGRLLGAGAEVTMIGREYLAERFRDQPLRVTDYLGFDAQTPLQPFHFVTDPAAVNNAGLVLIAVKSAGTEAAARAMQPHLPEGVPVISLQNGVRNADILQSLLPDNPILAGMVPFNILQKSPGHFHQGTEGHLMAAEHERLQLFLPAFESAGLPLELRADMTEVLWSKLLLNLNNSINALSGLPLKEELSQRDYRRCLALAQSETLTLLREAGIKTVRLTPLPMAWLPTLMAVPDFLFRRLAQSMLAMDPVARSSMWEDLQAGRKTEVDYINGAVVALAESLGTRAPVNETLIDLIRQAEQGEQPPLSGDELHQELKQATTQRGA